MKVSIRGPKNQYDYCPDRRADRTQETGIVGVRVKHTCIGKGAASARAHPLVKNRAEHQVNRKTRTEAAVRCCECDGRGHFARECPTRLKRQKKLSVSPGRKTPSERSKRSHAPGGKQGTAISGNECEA